MAEILLILWFTVCLCFISGFVMGYFLGKARAAHYYEVSQTSTEKAIKDIINEHAQENTQNTED